MKRTIVTQIIALTIILSACPQATAAGFDWPQWRGPDRTDVSKETGLLKKWPDGGLKQVWVFNDAGLGYSGFSIVGGKLFTMGARGNTEFLIALDANTGKQLWTVELGAMFENAWGGGPRGTPTVDSDRVYALSGQGSLVCAETAGGKLIWKCTMSDFAGRIPKWGYAESPLVDGNQVVCTPGGPQGAMVALDKMTGKLIWQSKEFTDIAEYASIIAADCNGARQYIQLTMQHVVGIAAKDGKLLWQSDWPGKIAVVPTPIFRDGNVYVCSGYGIGCKAIKLGPKNEVTEVFANTVMVNHHGGVILVGDHLYGFSDKEGWVCQDFKTGEKVWAEKQALTKGAIACADGMFYCIEEKSGTVVLIAVSPKGWQEHGRFQLSPQSQNRSPRGRIWTHPVISNGKLYLRDQELVYCYDVKQK
ncbi:MAG: polyvinylalcohol dehydrogenase [Verrucomicrobia bacterium]|nr:polyvinylalcohol dehydrogenase [Verrucomicrobiota bacterium]